LVEWNRVLVPGGKLLLAVPDIELLAHHLLNSDMNRQQKVVMMGMIFGGQNDQYNIHFTGFYAEFAEDLLLYTNFCDIRRLTRFGLFQDASEIDLFGKGAISLNIAASRCPDGTNTTFEIY
jgi:predicted SAM-dependent methyltransferase